MSIFDDFDAVHSFGTYSSVPDINGDVDLFHDGNLVDHIDQSTPSFEHEEHPNIEGGKDVYKDGKLYSHGTPNVNCGVDVYHGGILEHMTIPNALGGVDVYNSDMQLEGSTTPNIFGGEDFTPFPGNDAEILSYDDPLLHSSDYKPTSF